MNLVKLFNPVITQVKGFFTIERVPLFFVFSILIHKYSLHSIAHTYQKDEEDRPPDVEIPVLLLPSSNFTFQR